MWRFEQLFRTFDVPWDYKSNLGSPSILLGNAVYNLPLMMLSALMGCVASAHKVWFVVMFTMAGYGFYRLFGQAFGSIEMGLVAGLYGMLNGWFIQRVSFGHNLLIFAYALLPFAFSSYISALETRGFLNSLLAGLLGASVTYISPHMGYLFLIFALVYTLVESVFALDRLKALYANVTCLVSIFLIMLIVLLPIAVPLVGVSANVYAIRREEVTHYTLNADSVTPFQLVCMLQALIIASVGIFLIVRRASPLGDERIRSLALTTGVLSAGSLLLYSGASRGLLLFMFDWIPGFFMFRDLSKLLVYAVYFTAIMLLVVVKYVRRRLLASRVLSLALVALLMAPSVAYPLASGDFAGSVRTVWVPWYYDELYKTLASEEEYFRVAFFPPATWATRYNWSNHYFLDPIVSLQAKPTLEIKSEMDLTQAASLARWAYLTLYGRKTDRIGSILGLMGVKYVVLRSDADMLPERADLAPFRLGSSKDLLFDASDLVYVGRLGPLKVYSTPYGLPHVYGVDKLSLVVGDRRALLSLLYLDSFDLFSSPPVFIDNLDNVAQILGGVDRIFLDPSRFEDVVIAAADGKVLARTWEALPLSSCEEEGWIRGDLAWYLEDGVADVAPDGYVLTNGRNTLTLSLKAPSPGMYTLFAQVFFIDRKGFTGLQASIDGSPPVKIEQTAGNPCGRYKWIAVGEYDLLEGTHEVRISSDGGSAAISKVALVPQNSYDEAMKALRVALASKDLIYVVDDYAWPDSTSLTLKEGCGLSNGLAARVPHDGISIPLYIPRSFNYELYLRIYGNGSLSMRFFDEDVGEVFDETLSVMSDDVSDLRVSGITLNDGWNHLNLAASGEIYVDLMSLSSCGICMCARRELVTSMNVTMTSGSSYRLNGVNASYLIFLEGWNPDWRLKWGDQSIAPLVVLGFANLFKVPSEGADDAKIEFEGARLMSMGFWMTIALLPVSAATVSMAMFLRKRWNKDTGASGKET